MNELPNFEKALDKLQETVKKLESGQLTLEDSLKNFEEGVRLVKNCQEYLDKAEKRVEILTKVNADGEPELKPFDSE